MAQGQLEQVRLPANAVPPGSEVADVREYLELAGVPLTGGARIGDADWWYHPPSDRLVRADRWDWWVGEWAGMQAAEAGEGEP